LLATPENESLSSSPPTLAPTTNSASISVDPEALTKAWEAYAGAVEKEVHLKNTMLACKPILTKNTVFEVFVHNPVQKDELDRYGSQILQSICNQLNDNRLQMNVRLSESNDKKAFTATEKYNLLRNANPIVARLEKEFDLGLE
jgi:DNA polymerase-3 subunit gamma/tau